MLSVEGLHVNYGRVAALRDVSLNVERGEIVGLVGPNGAGKSTLLAAIVGQSPKPRGAITFEGVPLLGRATEKIVRLGIALVPEGRHIFATMTVADNLLLGTTLLRGGSDAVASAVEGVLDRFPALRRHYRSSAGKLSGGEQQQLAIGRAMLGQPQLLLLDEPSLGLAPLLVDVVFEILQSLRDEGVTILLVEQNAYRTVALADRTYVLRSGEIALAKPRDELLAMEDMASVYLGA